MTKPLVLLAAGAALAVPTAAVAEPLVTADWLADRLDAPDLVVLDIRNRIDGGSAETYAAGHIPGAVYSDYAEAGWRQPRDGVVGMLPPVEDLEALIGGLGIDNGDHVVIVPAGVGPTDFGSATRVYWTFKVLGHETVSILDGGYAAWVAGGHAVDEGGVTPVAASFTADFQPDLVATAEDVAAAADGSVALVDARPNGQYIGDDKAGPVARPGTLPGAVNLPNGTLVSEDGFARPAADVEALLASVDVAAEGPQIAFCNTGHWASVAWFAASEIAGIDDVALYDGSMTEWTAQDDRPVVVGATAIAECPTC